jgi:alpha-tubulin suppressor-like RCC1 family protein
MNIRSLSGDALAAFNATIISVLCGALLTAGAMAATPNLQTIDVTPTTKTIFVGQKQTFTATGTFSNGMKHSLEPAIGNLAPGDAATCVWLIYGGVNCWGQNGSGQLGDGTTRDSLTARPVKWITTAAAVALGSEHGCALLARGTVQCWGRNDSGQLGNRTPGPATTPVPVSGITTAIALSLGAAHSCALLAKGAIQCWGYNYEGELGDGTNTRSSIPVTVGGISTAVAIAVRNTHSCALLASGAVQCWGDNTYGQLGNGTTTNSNVPVTVSGINSATAIAAGAFFNCALLSSGVVQCWGHNGNAELGDGSSWPYADSSVPVSVADISTAIAITAGGYHACAVLSSGSGQCWGYNSYGQLGNGSTTASASIRPVAVSTIGAPVRLAAGYWHTCALLAGGVMRCWGLNHDGQLGNRRRTPAYTPNRWPVNVVGTPGVVWASSDSSKATINGRGLATGRAVGNTTITATTDGFINDNAVLTVQ